MSNSKPKETTPHILCAGPWTSLLQELAAAKRLSGHKGQLGQAHKRKIHEEVLNPKTLGGLGQELQIQ